METGSRAGLSDYALAFGNLRLGCSQRILDSCDADASGGAWFMWPVYSEPTESLLPVHKVRQTWSFVPKPAPLQPNLVRQLAQKRQHRTSLLLVRPLGASR